MIDFSDRFKDAKKMSDLYTFVMDHPLIDQQVKDAITHSYEQWSDLDEIVMNAFKYFGIGLMVLPLRTIAPIIPFSHIAMTGLFLVDTYRYKKKGSTMQKHHPLWKAPLMLLTGQFGYIFTSLPGSTDFHSLRFIRYWMSEGIYNARGNKGYRLGEDEVAQYFNASPSSFEQQIITAKGTYFRIANALNRL